MALTAREEKDLRDALADQEGSPSQLTEKLKAAILETDTSAADRTAIAALGLLSAAGAAGTDATLIDNLNAKVDAILGQFGAV